jgi:hypothetical protein
LKIATLFRRVAIDINAATGGRQLPELSITVSGEFYLNTPAYRRGQASRLKRPAAVE